MNPEVIGTISKETPSGTVKAIVYLLSENPIHIRIEKTKSNRL